MKKIILKSIIPVLGIVFFYACSKKNIPSTTNNFHRVDSVSVLIVDSAAAKEEVVEEQKLQGKNAEIDILKFHRKLNMDSLLNSYNAEIPNLEELIYPLDSVMDADSSRVVVIGKFINEKDVFAFDVYGDSDTCFVDFYKFNNKWEKLKSDNYEFWMLYDFRFENFNEDEDTEILFLGPPNMNGNKQNTIYKFDYNENKFVKSCGFFATELTYDSKSNLLHYQYFGSWYMDEIQAIYKWSNNRIIPVKEVRKSLKSQKLSNVGNFNSNTLISYSENPTQDKDTLVLKFKKTYREKNKKMYDLWENFFENK